MKLIKQRPGLPTVRRGFLQGKIHPDDLDPMIDLLTRFYWMKQLNMAIPAWTATVSHHDEKAASRIMEQIKELNEQLTELEEDFSGALGEGSRFLERVVLSLITIAAIMVKSVGLGLAVLTARAISREFNQLNVATCAIGEGNFSAADLARLAEENARLYGDASRALERRDECLSLASHELKTPNTSMLIRSQMLTTGGESRTSPDQVRKFSSFLERQLLRINDLFKEMLDTSRIDLSKLGLRLEPLDLSALATEVSRRLSPQFDQLGTPLELNIEPAIA
jgi:signal transduction histidine kinase